MPQLSKVCVGGDFMVCITSQGQLDGQMHIFCRFLSRLMILFVHNVQPLNYITLDHILVAKCLAFDLPPSFYFAAGSVYAWGQGNTHA
jgi:hypothetical protein